ncbi:MAG: hypothetical protein ACE5HD_11460 [Acidobacteriota bacterium]
MSVDRFLIRHLDEMTRAKIRSLLDAGRLRINQQPSSGPKDRLQAGDQVEISPPRPARDSGARLLHQDPAILVLCKSPGLSMTAQLLRTYGSPARVVLAPYHPFSGVVLAARHPQASRFLSAQFSGGQGGCRLTTLVNHHHTLRSRFAKRACHGWHVKLLRRFRYHALLGLVPPRPLDADPRLLLRALGLTPVVLPGRTPSRLAIHLTGVHFTHPHSGHTLRFDPPLPSPYRRYLEQLPPVPTLAAPCAAAPPHQAAADRRPGEGPEPALRSPRDLMRRSPRRRERSG